MAIFKCKMCGGSLEINNESVATCEYCGTQQTLPKLDNDRRANLYDRANHFRRNNEFDKATGIYEQILNEDNTDAEAYWSIVLCRYGIEYVEDPATHKRSPTVNRAQFTAIFDDDNYKSALRYADSQQKAIYEQEAKTINEIQKGILAISQKEAPFDVFICYKETDQNGRRTPDSVLATELYHELTREGFKVFFSRITLEDKLGSAYEPYIFAALNSAKVMVVLGTRQEYFNAVWVKNEWSRYLSLIKQGQKKMLIPAYRDMDPYDMPEEFSHLQAQDMSKLGFMQDLVRGIGKIVQANTPKPAVAKETVATGNANIAPLLKRAFMFLEDGDWSSADEYCEKVLDIDPECAQAYLGKLMVQMRVKKREDLQHCNRSFAENSNYRNLVRFADEALKKELIDYITKINTKKASSGSKTEIKIATILGIGIFIVAILILIITAIKPKTDSTQEMAKQSATISTQQQKDILTQQPKDIQVGDYITFGTYEQDNNATNGKEKIDWMVLHKEGNRALVISKYALDCLPYNIVSTEVIWETCTLQQWLNSDFYNNSFTAEEKGIITQTSTSTYATQNYLFLLNAAEAEQLFDSDKARQCQATAYAISRGTYVNAADQICWWWLRTSGNAQLTAASVRCEGDINKNGYAVNSTLAGVRPAMWIDLNAIQ